MGVKIEIRNVKKSFGNRVVLDGINLTVEPGVTQVVLGGSGTGKSVLLKCILGLIPVDSGQILVDGKDVTHLTEKEQHALMRKFGMLFQSAALFDSMSVWENVAFVPLHDDVPPAQAKELAIRKLAQVGLKAEVADMTPAELSGGMRKRVGLARAICHDPAIVFYDEPTTGLDPITADVINELIIQTKNDLHCTAIAITHDMHSAFKIADRMAFLYQGQFIAEGTPKDFRASKNAYVQQFVEGRADGPIKVIV